MIQQMQNEVKIMYSLNHPNILKLFNHFEDDNHVYLILEFAPGVSIYSQGPSLSGPLEAALEEIRREKHGQVHSPTLNGTRPCPLQRVYPQGHQT